MGLVHRACLKTGGRIEEEETEMRGSESEWPKVKKGGQEIADEDTDTDVMTGKEKREVKKEVTERKDWGWCECKGKAGRTEKELLELEKTREDL